MARVFIGLGSNLCSPLGSPLEHLQLARSRMNGLGSTRVEACSSIYQSPALTLDNEPQNDYLNAVIELQTGLDAQQLLQSLQKIEHDQGRVREKRWAARTLDLDILLYDDLQIHSEHLVVPHAQMTQRRFVLEPLYEISGDMAIAGQGQLKHLLQKVAEQPLKKMGEFNG